MHKRKKLKPGPPKGSKRSEKKRSPFGERLNSIRKTRGLTQRDFGKKVNLSNRMISYYESDTQGPPVAVLLKMAEVLNVTASYLLGESPLKITHDETDQTLKKKIEEIKSLARPDQKNVYRLIESLADKSKLEKKIAASPEPTT
jgi:transcriptional regulator with XRE-family HTH domain